MWVIKFLFTGKIEPLKINDSDYPKLARKNTRKKNNRVVRLPKANSTQTIRKGL